MASDATYAIRRLTSADLDPLRGLLSVYGEAFEDLDTYRQAPPSDAYLSKLVGKSQVIVVAAFAGDEIVGGLTAYVLDKLEQERREVYIYDLAVAEQHRRRRIATRLIQALQTIAHDIGAHVIFVQADLVDAPAIALYESLGTKETAHHFDIEVRRVQ